MSRKKLWRERSAKTPEQYVEMRLLEFARKVYVQVVKERDLDVYEEVVYREDGTERFSDEILDVRRVVAEKTTAELRSFRGDTADIAKGRDITLRWNRWSVTSVRFKTRSVVDRLADLGSDGG